MASSTAALPLNITAAPQEPSKPTAAPQESLDCPSLPFRQPLLGHYLFVPKKAELVETRDYQFNRVAALRSQQRIFTVYNGWRSTVLQTPEPQDASALPTSTPNIRYDQPVYISHRSPYLMFVPRYNPWKGSSFFASLDYTFESLPVIECEGKYMLDRLTAKDWEGHECSMRQLADAIFIASARGPPEGMVPVIFPYRYHYTGLYKTDRGARVASWRARNAFLASLGYVSMAFWVMRFHETRMTDPTGSGPTPWKKDGKRARRDDQEGDTELPVPAWHDDVLKRSGVEPSYLDGLESSVASDWSVPRVGGLLDLTDRRSYSLHKSLHLEWLLGSILDSDVPIPMYINWGPMDKIHSGEVPSFLYNRRLHPFALGETDYLLGLPGDLKFSQWIFDESGFSPSASNRTPAADVTEPARTSSRSFERVPADGPLAAGPPVEKGSGQRQGESLEHFFARRATSNSRRQESPKDKQRRDQREANARKGEAPGRRGATVFYWDCEVPGWPIRRAAGRSSYEHYFSIYPASQRRYDGYTDQWDLCELFDNGEADSDDEDDGQGYECYASGNGFVPPMFTNHGPQPGGSGQTHGAPMTRDLAGISQMDVEMRDEREHQSVADESMECLEDSHQDAHFISDEDRELLPESELPLFDAKAASRWVLHRINARSAPPMDEGQIHHPQYARIGENVIDALQRRFGFNLPLDDPHIVPSDKVLQIVQSLVGMTLDPANQFQSIQTFFESFSKASVPADIPPHLLDVYDHPTSRLSKPRPFSIRRETLQKWSGICSEDSTDNDRLNLTLGDEVTASSEWYILGHDRAEWDHVRCLLFPCAATVVEVLRQGWGPTIDDIALELVSRGMEFRLGISVAVWGGSDNEKPDVAKLTSPAPKSAKRKREGHLDINNHSGLGFRPDGYRPTLLDHQTFVATRNMELVHTPRGPIALQYGGLIGRIARAEISDEKVLLCPRWDAGVKGEFLWDGVSRDGYWYEEFTCSELDLLAGVYNVSTKKVLGKGKAAREQVTRVSWWPQLRSWKKVAFAGWWSPDWEKWYLHRLDRLENERKFNEAGILCTAEQWKNALRFDRNIRPWLSAHEVVSKVIVDDVIERGCTT